MGANIYRRWYVKLMAIGSEYEHQFPPLQTSTDNRAHVFTYRVVAHVPIFDGRDSRLAEEIRAVSVRYRNVIGLEFVPDTLGGRMLPILDGEGPEPFVGEYVDVDPIPTSEAERKEAWAAIRTLSAMA